MDRNMLLTATVLVSIMNGMISPALFPVMVLWPAWFPTLILPATGNFVLFLSSLIVSTSTLMVSAVGAALYERLAGLKQSDMTSTAIWLGGAVLLTLPGLLPLF